MLDEGCVISGFGHEVCKNCALLDYYAASSDNFLPMFWGNLSVPHQSALLRKKDISQSCKSIYPLFLLYSKKCIVLVFTIMEVMLSSL